MVRYSPRLYRAWAGLGFEKYDRAMFYMFGAQEANPLVNQTVMHAQCFAALIAELAERYPNRAWEGYKTYYRRYEAGLPIDMSADLLGGAYGLNADMSEIEVLLKPVDEAGYVFGPVETGIIDELNRQENLYREGGAE